MDKILQELSLCIEFGKVDQNALYPPQFKGKPGADEITQQVLSSGYPPDEILNNSLIPAMQKVGAKFRENRIFLPEVLMAAKSMNAAMEHLKPFFQSGEIKRKGTFVIGTVTGDLHDIGKNLVAMMVGGSGWNVVDLGVDADHRKYLKAIEEYPGCSIGMSALLTTTMKNMVEIISEIRKSYPETKILIGGAPVNETFRKTTGADFYSRDPQGAVDYLYGLT